MSIQLSRSKSKINNSIIYFPSKKLNIVVGPDMEFDFDMLISKEAGSEVETPWHQDESYWLDLPDKVRREISTELYF